MSKVTKQAVIHINKLGAAQRQLDAAIRMTFANEDELAIHTVAAAAYRILRDLLEKRGQQDYENLLRAGLYEYSRSLANGEMSGAEIDTLKRQPELYSIVLVVADDIKARGAEVTLDDMPIALTKSEKVSDWRNLSGAANFLKHADKDPDAHLPLEKLDNNTLLLRACGAFMQVSHSSTPEVRVFHIFSSLAFEHREDLKEIGADTIADFLEKLSPSRRRLACAKMIREIKKAKPLG